MSRGFGSLAAFSAFVGTRMGRLVDHGAQVGLEEGARQIQQTAREAIGTYTFNWTPLADETLARKKADTPLLETGEMRDSIQVEAGYHRARVYSDDPKFIYHELGTVRNGSVHIPARPVLSEATVRCEAGVAHRIGRRVVAALSGESVEIMGAPGR